MALNASVVECYWDNVLVTDVLDAQSFTLQLLGSQKQYAELMGRIQEFCSTSSQLPQSFSKGAPLLAKFDFDLQWYRAVVIGTEPEDAVQVLYVDYGNMEKVAKKDTREPPKKFFEIPAQGVRCMLNRIDFKRRVDERFHSEFKNKCLNQQFTAKFVEHDSSAEIWTVELYNSRGSVNDWYGNLCSCLIPRSATEPIPASLPHPHNAGLTAQKTSTGNMNLRSNASNPSVPQSKKAATKRNIPAEFSAVVVYCISPHQFWMQMSCDADAVMDIGVQLENICNGDQNAVLVRPEIDKVCAALYDADQTWYRAKILSLDSSNAKVFFVDYGNTESVPLKNLMTLPAALASQPGFALEAQLFGVQPMSGTEWSKDSVDSFMNLAMAEECGVIVVEGDIPLKVNITINGESLANLLIKGCIAKSSSNKQAGESCSQSSTGSSVPFMDLKPNQSLQAICVFAVSTSEFYCQRTDNEQCITEMMSKISTLYPGSFSMIRDPVVGMNCCALYSEDGAWYRAVIKEILSDSVKVFFIDYGNTEVTLLEMLREMHKDLMSTPCQAIRCALQIPNAKSCRPEAEEQFLSDIIQGELTLKVQKNSGDTYIVDVKLGSKDIVSEMFKDTEKTLTVNTAKVSNEKATYPQQIVDSSERVQVFVSWQLHPGSFWVQRQDSESLLQELLNLSEKCANETKPLAHIEQGMACLAQYSADSQWYRGEITDACEHGDFKVLFVDYGNTEETPTQNIRPISQSLLNLSPLAFHCSLIGVQPNNGNAWSKESHDVMDSLLVDGCSCTFLAKHSNSYLVDIVFNGEQSLAEALIEKGVAKSTRKDSRSSEKSHGSHRSTSSGRMPKAAFSPVKPISTPDKSVDGAGDRIKPELVHIPICSLKNLGTSLGRKELMIVHISDLQHIYGHLVPNKSSIDSLYNTIGDFYHNNKGKTVSQAFVDSHYAVQFMQDGEWYRAKVISADGDNVEVFYIDYGNQEKTHLSRLRVLSTEFAQLPAQALCCRISDSSFEHNKNKFQEFKQTYEFAVVTAELLEEKADYAVARLCSNGVDIMNFFMENGAIVSGTESADLVDTLLYPCLVIECGQFNGYITHINGQQSFYVQRADDSDMLSDINANISEEIVTNEHLSSYQTDQPCLALFSDDNCWYRAKILEQDKNGVKVQFVDYGNLGMVSKDNLLQISEALVQVPPLAIHCKLNQSAASLDLKEWAGEEQLTINALGIADGLANVEISNSVGQMFAEAPTNCKQEETKIRSHDAMSSLSDGASPIEAEEKVLRLPLVTVAEGEHKAYLSHAERSTEIYVQLSSNADILNHITSTLALEGAGAAPDVYCPVGHTCIALYTTDGLWYRAVVVKSVSTNGTSQVKFVDFGNTEAVYASQMKILPDSLRCIPPVAVHCRASPSTPLYKLTREQIINKLGGKELSVRFSGSQEPYSIEIDELVEESGCSLTGMDAYSYRLPEANIRESDDPIPVFVTHTESPSKFHCQLAPDIVDIIADRLHQTYNIDHECYSMDQNMCKIGVVCVAKWSEDGLWYRGIIVSDEVDSHYQVEFVDYGNCERVSLNSICRITSELAEFPKQAIICELLGVYPLKGIHWGEHAIEKFKEMAEQGDLEGIIQKVIKTDGTTDKALMILSSANESIADLLIHSGLASKIPKSEVPISVFCKNLCNDITSKIQSSEGFTPDLLLTKMQEFVSCLNETMTVEISNMPHGDGSHCTAQDIVKHVTYKVLSSIFNTSYSPDNQIQLAVPLKELMTVEVSDILADLLLQFMRVHEVIAKQILDDGLSTPDLSQVSHNVIPSPADDEAGSDRIVKLALEAKQVIYNRNSNLDEYDSCPSFPDLPTINPVEVNQSAGPIDFTDIEIESNIVSGNSMHITVNGFPLMIDLVKTSQDLIFDGHARLTVDLGSTGDMKVDGRELYGNVDLIDLEPVEPSREEVWINENLLNTISLIDEDKDEVFFQPSNIFQVDTSKQQGLRTLSVHHTTSSQIRANDLIGFEKPFFEDKTEDDLKLRDESGCPGDASTIIADWITPMTSFRDQQFCEESPQISYMENLAEDMPLISFPSINLNENSVSSDNLSFSCTKPLQDIQELSVHSEQDVSSMSGKSDMLLLDPSWFCLRDTSIDDPFGDSYFKSTPEQKTMSFIGHENPNNSCNSADLNEVGNAFAQAQSCMLSSNEPEDVGENPQPLLFEEIHTGYFGNDLRKPIGDPFCSDDCLNATVTDALKPADASQFQTSLQELFQESELTNCEDIMLLQSQLGESRANNEESTDSADTAELLKSIAEALKNLRI